MDAVSATSSSLPDDSQSKQIDDVIKRLSIPKLEIDGLRTNQAELSSTPSSQEENYSRRLKTQIYDRFNYNSTEQITENSQPAIVTKASNRLLPKDADTYQLEDFESNEMFIFNHNNITGFSEGRLGTDSDVTALVDTFEKFKFNVHVYEDLKHEEIFETLRELENSDLNEIGCTIVVVLSHGDIEGRIWAKDRTYHESELISVFQNSPNESLNGKPVLFFIQACRGYNVGKLTFDARQMESYTLPEEADILLLHSTYQGKPSTRHTVEGSWFIQSLCDKINEFETDDLYSIITRVLRTVAVEKVNVIEDKISGEEITFKQMPVFMSTLTRKLYLRKPNSVTDTSSGFQDASESLDKSKEVAIDVTGNYADNTYSKEVFNEKQLFTFIPKQSGHDRSYSMGDASQINIEIPCSSCEIFRSEAKELCVAYFDYLWDVFTDFVEKQKPHGDRSDILVDWQSHLDVSNVEQVKALTKHVAQFLNTRAKDWEGYPFIYFGQHSRKDT